ncbi:MAG: hypothetical protein ACE5JK_06245 [Candidatus Omnitrophota bacterium]
MKKLTAILVILFMLGGIFTIAAEAGTVGKVKAIIKKAIKTRGQTTLTPTGGGAVRG